MTFLVNLMEAEMLITLFLHDQHVVWQEKMVVSEINRKRRVACLEKRKLQ